MEYGSLCRAMQVGLSAFYRGLITGNNSETFECLLFAIVVGLALMRVKPVTLDFCRIL